MLVKAYYRVTAFAAVAWSLGQVVETVQCPGLVGEFLGGLLVGPHGLGVVTDDLKAGLIAAGEVGLIMLVFEGGLGMDTSVLKSVGVRAFVLAFTGTALPVLAGWLLMWLLGFGMLESVACGTALSSTAIGFTIKLMQDVKILRTPMGQLITAAAMIDDVFSLVVLATLQGLQGGNVVVWNVVQPLVSSLGVFIGAALFRWCALRAVAAYPTTWRPRRPDPPAPEDELLRPLVLLGMAVCCMTLTAAAEAARSTHLLGTFMGGMVFCTLPVAQSIYESATPVATEWLSRMFFAASVAFLVPTEALFAVEAIGYGLLLTLAAILGKFLSGLWAAPLDTPGFWKKACQVGAAMIGRGELGFMLAAESHRTHMVGNIAFSATVWALVLATVLGPIAFRLTLRWGGTETDDTGKEAPLPSPASGAGGPVVSIPESVPANTELQRADSQVENNL